MKNKSIWIDTVKSKKYPILNSDIDTDVLIIGGGITGISTLYQLRDSNLKVTLVEQNKIGMAVTGKSTGKINYLQNDLLDKIRNNFNDRIASLYLKSQIYAKDEIVRTIKDKNIDCDLENVNTYLYTNKEEEIDKIKLLEKFLKENDIKIYNDKVDLVKSLYAIKVDDCYVFHLIKFLYGLVNEIKADIYEDTSIKKIDKVDDFYICKTDKNIIKAKWVVIASHYPYFTIPYLFPLKSSLEKSYISASIYDTKPLSLISYKNPVISVRNYKEYLIYLTNSHLINKKVDDKNNFNNHLKELKKLKINANYLWSNIDVMSNDRLPYIGRIKDNLLIGTGYNTWGFTNGFLAGIILSDIIKGNKNKYESLFNPNRINLAKTINIIPNAINSIEGYLKGLFVTNSNIKYTKKNGKDIMIYNDGKKEYVVCRNCPHLGCKLLFNEVEESWDCSCHGSRFDKEGKCISGPSNKNINIIKEK